MSGPRTPNAVWSSWFTRVEPDQHDEREQRLAAAHLARRTGAACAGMWNGNPRTVNQHRCGGFGAVMNALIRWISTNVSTSRLAGSAASAIAPSRSSTRDRRARRACRRRGSGRGCPCGARTSAARRRARRRTRHRDRPGMSISTSSRPAPVARNAYSRRAGSTARRTRRSRRAPRPPIEPSPPTTTIAKICRLAVGRERLASTSSCCCSTNSAPATPARKPEIANASMSALRAPIEYASRGAFVVAHADEHAAGPARAQAAHREQAEREHDDARASRTRSRSRRDDAETAACAGSRRSGSQLLNGE